MLWVRTRASGLAVTWPDFHRAPSAHSPSPPKPSQDTDTLDSEGWSALHHALDSSSFSARAALAARDLAQRTPPRIINTGTTGSQPSGYTCLHFACDGSDRSFKRVELAGLLLDRRANLEAREQKGNTPLLLASGAGIADVVELLLRRRADVTAVNHRGVGALQKALNHSTDVRAILERAGAPRTEVGGPLRRKRTTVDSTLVDFGFWHPGARAPTPSFRAPSQASGLRGRASPWSRKNENRSMYCQRLFVPWAMAGSGRTRTGVSDQRQVRYMRAQSPWLPSLGCGHPASTPHTRRKARLSPTSAKGGLDA